MENVFYLLFSSVIRRYLPPRICIPLQHLVGIVILIQPILGAGDQLEKLFIALIARQFGFALFLLDPG